MKKLNIKSQPAETYVLADKEYERSRFYAIIESISARIIFGFTTGAFLAGFLKYIGAEDKLCGQISALTVLAGVIQFFSPFVLEKLNRRKAVVASFSAIHRFMLVMLVLVPVLPVSMIGRLYITAALYFVSHLMVNAVAPAATNLIISIVPQKMRGRYFSNREAYLIFASSVLNIIMGKVLDVFKLQNKTYEGYLIMYAVALAAMLLNLFSYIKIKEPPLPVPRKNINFKMLFSLPLKEKKFRKIIVLFFLWGLSLNFASPFFSVYMVSKLELSYTFIMISGFLNSLSYVIATRFWGRVADRFSFTYSASFIAIAISSRLSLAAFSPISGFAPDPRPLVSFSPIWILVLAFDRNNACLSVFTAIKSTPRSPASIIRFTALFPPPPTPTTLMRAKLSISISNSSKPVSPFIYLILCKDNFCLKPIKKMIFFQFRLFTVKRLKFLLK
jgi:hypothetical protein